MKIQVLYSRQTGRSEQADEQLKQALEATSVEADVEYIEVDGMEDARAKRFLGTPSIRVAGVDVEYGEREPDEYQQGMRYYNTPEGWKPFPHARLIANAILEAAEREKAKGS